jgi:hypothetical protein
LNELLEGLGILLLTIVILCALVFCGVLLIIHLIKWVSRRRRYKDLISVHTESNISPPTVNPHFSSRPEASPDGKEWWVYPNGQASENEPNKSSETRDTFVPDETLNVPFSINNGVDYLKNEQVNRLLEKGKITVEEAISIRQHISSMNNIESERFLSAIEHRAENESTRSW